MARLFACTLLALAAAAPAHGWSWPVEGAVLQPFVTGPSPYAGGQHRGLDIAAEDGAPVRAPAAGVVSFAGTVPHGGRTLTIRTADGFSVTLLHLGSLMVRGAAVVTEGQTVGAVGPSGDVEHDRPYVHLGLRRTDDEHGYVDPLTLLPPATEPVIQPEPVGTAETSPARPQSASQPEPVGVPVPTSATAVSAAATEVGAPSTAAVTTPEVADSSMSAAAAAGGSREPRPATAQEVHLAGAPAGVAHARGPAMRPSGVPERSRTATVGPTRAADRASPVSTTSRHVPPEHTARTAEANRASGPRQRPSVPRGDPPRQRQPVTPPTLAPVADHSRALRWWAAGALILLVLAGAATLAVRARRGVVARPEPGPPSLPVPGTCSVGGRERPHRPCVRAAGPSGCRTRRQVARSRPLRVQRPVSRRRSPVPA